MFLRDTDASKTALLAESESYAARSQLIRNIETMLQSLRNVRTYWTRYGSLPRDKWADDAGIEFEHFEGIQAIIWSDSARDIRYMLTAQKPVFDYRPSNEEWQSRSDLLAEARLVEGEAILGPYASDSELHIHVVLNGASDEGSLIAVFDAGKTFASLLRDQSPGYAITVRWNDATLYQRDRGATDVPQNWTREGRIRTSTGTTWTVVHTPTVALADSLATPTIDAVLPLGFIIAVLLGLIILENGRARSRALAAEKAERRIAQLNKNLEQEVADRTEELANRTFDLVTITDSVAHDLRNPLNSISVNTQVLEQQFASTLGQEGLAALGRTASGIRRMTEILDRLVGLSVASHSTFRRERIDMQALVTQVFEAIRLAEPPPPVAFVLGNLPDVDADRTLVQTLVLNLLSNALKYTRTKPYRRIDVSSSTANGISTYCIRDNGVGFDSQHADRMFQAFERLPGEQKSDGLGLGLMIAARVVKRHRGLIWAEGAIGEGATFCFTLQHKQDTETAA